jgi:cobalt-zinc-cadmium efflux system membrane fusion protein
MKKQLYITKILFVLLITGMVWSCTSETEHDHDEAMHVDDHDDHYDHENGVKMVELNQAQLKNAGVKLGDFEMKNMSETVNANGYTKLPPQNQADVAMHTTGLIKSIRVLEGQEIKKGQVLATMESPEFAILQEAYLRSKSQLDYLQKEYERQLKLSEDNINAKKVVEKTKSDLETEKAHFRSLERQLAIYGINGNGAIVSTISIKAPIGGHITAVNVKIGSAVEVGAPLFSIVDNSEMHVDLQVYEKDLEKVREGQRVRFVLTNQSHTEITGQIFNIGKSFENETKTVAVHAHIEDKEKFLIPGMYVNAIIDVGEQEVKTLPAEAVIQAEGRYFIFVKAADQHDEHTEFRRLEVSVGSSQLGYLEVTPVQKRVKGEKIVISGAYYLQSHLQKSDGGGGHHH